jgi:hypothetical protein
VILQVQFKRHGDVTDKGERQNKEEKVNRTKRRTIRYPVPTKKNLLHKYHMGMGFI